MLGMSLRVVWLELDGATSRPTAGSGSSIPATPRCPDRSPASLLPRAWSRAGVPRSSLGATEAEDPIEDQADHAGREIEIADLHVMSLPVARMCGVCGSSPTSKFCATGQTCRSRPATSFGKLGARANCSVLLIAASGIFGSGLATHQFRKGLWGSLGETAAYG
jgi:hypothetical protein